MAPPASQGYAQPAVYAQPPPPPPSVSDTRNAPWSGASQAPTGTAAPPPTTSPVVPGPESPTDLASALGQLDAEARALTGVLASCTTACRSLGSMERAVHVVCELTRDGDHTRCDEARKKLRDARERVRVGCGVCEGGPRTDPTAPDP